MLSIGFIGILWIVMIGCSGFKNFETYLEHSLLTWGFELEEFAKVNILDKWLRIGDLKISIGLFDDFGLVYVFGLGLG